ncbi:hypothetical protein A5320_12310 [Rheinheimera sp. SA_1]|jgi:hypothetical protein|uniref:hypothetical protein n=1 Tax=Rheinheimera sp. SA_1 TaxID=1827365 RepID=UPI0007FB76B9|nr:hypothetical protein [Rheinheimera sp. SA_1]OBP14541.1 hypothetical protein A5320_12310 [Rheinheimera sp. SA_1]
MTSDFVKQVHLETARRYQQQGHDIDYLVSHFQKVALDQDDIAELLTEIAPTSAATERNGRQTA